MSEEPGDQLIYEKERAERAEAELQKFKSDAKELQQMLQEQNKQKEAQIRKLKQDAIMSEKKFKSQRAELTKLITENTSLKQQLATNMNMTTILTASSLQALEEQNIKLKSTIEDLTKQVEKERENSQKLEQNYRKNQSQWERKDKLLHEEVQMAKNLADQLRKYNAILTEKLKNFSNKQSQSTSIINPTTLPKVNDEAKDINFDKQEYELRIKNLQEANRRLEQFLAQNDMLLKQYKEKITDMTEQTESLQNKIAALSLSNNANSSPELIINNFNHTRTTFPSPFTLKSSVQDDDFSWNKINYSCLLITKPHYVSPFLEVYEEKKLVKIYKSTRTGCYEKSMGVYKHKFDVLTYQQDQIIDPVVQTIFESEEVINHSVVIFGAKKCSKKYIMSKILVKLKNFLMSKLEGSTSSTATYIRKSQEQEKNIHEHAKDKKSILEVINKVIALGYKNDKVRQGKIGVSPKKTQSKPKVRYFSLIADNFSFEIGTSSFSGQNFNQKISPVDMLNNIFYTRLPNILQSTVSQKYLILTLNPIVDLYQQCRTTLSTTLCKAYQPINEDNRQWRNSPVKEDLNDLAKKKMEAIQRQNEQSVIRCRRLEEECQYYRSRFDQLESRIKNLLNTHGGQNSTYLKKSPVALSYEKLLKFVHAVQSYSQKVGISQFGGLLNRAQNIYIEKEGEQMDAL